MTPRLYTTVPSDPAQRLLVEQALERDPLIWSPFEDDETRGYTPIPVRGDPERPFGIVRHEAPHEWQELTGRRDVLTQRGYYHDALAGIIRDYRISHWWNDDPQATNCLLCGAPNPGHPQYDYDLDNVQCPIIPHLHHGRLPGNPAAAQPDGRTGPPRHRGSHQTDRRLPGLTKGYCTHCSKGYCTHYPKRKFRVNSE